MNGRQRRRRRLPCSMAAGLIRASPAAGASLALPCFVSGSPRSELPRHVQPAAVPAAAAAAPAPPPAAAAAPPPPGAAGRPVSAATRGRGSRACPGGPRSSASLPSVPPRPARTAAGPAAGLPSRGGEGDKGRRGRGGSRPRCGQSRGAGGLRRRPGGGCAVRDGAWRAGGGLRGTAQPLWGGRAGGQPGVQPQPGSPFPRPSGGASPPAGSLAPRSPPRRAGQGMMPGSRVSAPRGRGRPGRPPGWVSGERRWENAFSRRNSPRAARRHPEETARFVILLLSISCLFIFFLQPGVLAWVRLLNLFLQWHQC